MAHWYSAVLGTMGGEVEKSILQLYVTCVNEAASCKSAIPGELSFLKCQSSVDVPAVCIIAAAVVNAPNQLGFTQDMLVTSGNDGQHMTGSKHDTDAALDFRTKHLTRDEKHRLVAAVRKRLGRNYDVIWESEC